MTQEPRRIGVPRMGLVLLVGASGSGKSTFARTHFLPTEVVSSDTCRGLVADDENDQSATPDAFEVLEFIVGVRLRRGLLTVVDATNVQPQARASLVRLAKSHDVLVDAIVLDVPERLAIDRNRQRADRTFGDHVVSRQQRDLSKSLKRMKREGFRRVHVLHGPEEIAAAVIERERSWNDRRDEHGPFDVIGDVHGCAGELRTLLGDLGWHLSLDDEGRAVGATHPEGRRAVFVGDLVDRGPRTPEVLRLVMGMVEAGTAFCVAGNHEVKLVRALQGANVRLRHGIAESMVQLEAESEEFRADALRFMDRLVSHLVLDGGDLVVAHAGLKESYHGRSSGRVRAFALYGDTTGETDEFGLPVRYPWANEYRGSAAVVYGHTPVPTAEWINNTICLDTGAVFGGALTALRWPEREIVAVQAEEQWYEPARPLAPATTEPGAADRDPGVLRLDDVTGTQWLDAGAGTAYAGRVKIPEENAAAALEVMSRFAIDPRWLVHLPATMSPVATATGERAETYLEHPDEAFDEYAGWGLSRVVCEEKHMGSRAIAVLCRDADVAARRFGVTDGSAGVVHTRTGRAFFGGELGVRLVGGLRETYAPLFAALGTDWLVLDGELLPWSAKAGGLIRDQFASVGAAAAHALPAALGVLDQAASRGLDVADLTTRTRQRLDEATAFREAYRRYVRPTDGLDGVSFAPFAVLAGEGEAYAATRTHAWHLAQLAPITAAGHPLIIPTRHQFVDLASPASRAEATAWWRELTESGGEGMVVKPADGEGETPARGVQPGVKVRGREYLRIVYGPDYTRSLDVLRDRRLGHKRQLARRETALGLESLAAFVEGRPLWQVHQLVFAVLALESEAVDPRL